MFQDMTLTKQILNKITVRNIKRQIQATEASVLHQLKAAIKLPFIHFYK